MSLNDSIKHIKGLTKREFIAQITSKFCDNSPRKAERLFDISRHTSKKGLKEEVTGIICCDNFIGRGRKRTEEQYPHLQDKIHQFLKEHHQTDPSFRTNLSYIKISAEIVKNLLVINNYKRKYKVPCRQTIGNILNRLDYRLRKILKAKPVKKIPETDAIFNNIQRVNNEIVNDKTVLRISIDSKAKVKVGNLSRNGKARGKINKKAEDHDMKFSTLTPFGISVVGGTQLDIFFGNAHETSDFIVDCITEWWNINKSKNAGIETILINLDNGPSVKSNRTQFLKRMVEMAKAFNINIRLMYYPPYHSKYNPIEHCWGILEIFWNGIILDSEETVLTCASQMTWRGVHPVIHRVNKDYEKGVKLTKKELDPYQKYIVHSNELPKWDLEIKSK